MREFLVREFQGDKYIIKCSGYKMCKSEFNGDTEWTFHDGDHVVAVLRNPLMVLDTDLVKQGA